MRLVLLLIACAAAGARPLPPEIAEPREVAQAVEFPYYLYPRPLWERELVWLKNLGIRTVEFSIPWNWHEVEPGTCDFTGRTSPRRDLIGFLRLLRRLEMRAWIRPLPPVRGWIDGGYPAWAAQERRSARPWLEELQKTLASQTEKHGGPIAFVEGNAGILDVPAPPAPVNAVSAESPAALMRSRELLAQARGSLLWEDVEDALYPAGWERAGGPLYHAGAVSLSGGERISVAPLRRDAALMRYWAALLRDMKAQRGRVRQATGKLPEGVGAVELVSRAPGVASAVSIGNLSGKPFHGDLRAWDPFAKRRVEINGVSLAPHETLWLPVNVTLGSGGLCRDCSAFSNAEHIVYANAELLSVEYENGVLAMEFAAPEAGEVVLQLARKPTGPYLAGGHPQDFDYDEKTLRARLPIPKGKGPGSQVRVGLAIEPPDASAFFVDAKRLVLGRSNIVSTSYSSEQLADRSRLRMPEGFTAQATRKSPLEIDYAVDVPADALHGDFADMAIEADGVPLGRAHLQLFRPASVRLPDAMRLHFGAAADLVVDPPIVPIDATAGRSLDVRVRNNSPGIETYRIQTVADGFQFLPANAELNCGAIMDRTAEFRVFAESVPAGLHDWNLHVSGGANLDIPARFLVIPRGQTVVWSADLDGDGAPEWVLENERARAVFSTQDGGRWLEFLWKDSNTNVLPESGALAGNGPVEVRAAGGDGLEFIGKGWKRTVRLAAREATITVEQGAPLAGETLESGKHNEVTLEVARESATREVYKLRK